MKKRKIMTLALVLSLTGMLFGGNSVYATESTIDSLSQNKNVTYVDGTASGTQYQYLSGEVTAMQYEIYSLATQRLKSIASSYTDKNKSMAVVLDLDETVLNNYGDEIRNYISGKGYSSSKFSEWVKEEKATAIPGSTEFLNTAKELGINIYYISNRSVEEKTATINNLKKLNLPFADDEHVLVKTDTSDKQKRVDEVSKTNNIVMFVGDNLGDFPAGFYKKSNEERKEIVECNKEKFGAEYIILPNSVYGDWDSATFGYDYSKTDEQKIQARIDGLESYEKQERTKIN